MYFLLRPSIVDSYDLVGNFNMDEIWKTGVGGGRDSQIWLYVYDIKGVFIDNNIDGVEC